MLRVRKPSGVSSGVLAGQAWDTGTVSLRERHSGFLETEGGRADGVKDPGDGEVRSRQEHWRGDTVWTEELKQDLYQWRLQAAWGGPA